MVHYPVLAISLLTNTDRQIQKLSEELCETDCCALETSWFFAIVVSSSGES